MMEAALESAAAGGRLIVRTERARGPRESAKQTREARGERARAPAAATKDIKRKISNIRLRTAIKRSTPTSAVTSIGGSNRRNRR